MSFSIGIVGLPNVGKSTLFKALTKKQVPAENFPFCTIDPNVGVVAVPDERLQKLSDRSNSEKIIPTTIEFVDIAGLVKDAHKGEGLGNQFLSHIRQTDAIAEVVRAFSDGNIIHVDGSVNPKRDRETIDLELVFADLSSAQKSLEHLRPKAKSGEKDAVQMQAILERCAKALGEGTALRDMEFTPEERKLLKSYNFLTLKPIIYIVNTDEGKETLPELGTNAVQVPISAKIESELAALPDAEAKEMQEALGMSSSGLDKLIAAAYKALELITFLTSGPAETRAWTITQGTKAPQAAGVIHTDFEKNFIRAEVITTDDFVNLGESGARDKGVLRIEGKDYVMRDGDVVHFRVNV